MALEILRDPRLERVEWRDLCDLSGLEVAYQVAIYVPWLVASCVFAWLGTHMTNRKLWRYQTGSLL